jgi:hypothetical protein
LLCHDLRLLLLLGLGPGVDIVGGDAWYLPPQLFNRDTEHRCSLAEPVHRRGECTSRGIAPYNLRVRVIPASFVICG